MEGTSHGLETGKQRSSVGHITTKNLKQKPLEKRLRIKPPAETYFDEETRVQPRKIVQGVHKKRKELRFTPSELDLYVRRHYKLPEKELVINQQLLDKVLLKPTHNKTRGSKYEMESQYQEGRESKRSEQISKETQDHPRSKTSNDSNDFFCYISQAVQSFYQKHPDCKEVSSCSITSKQKTTNPTLKVDKHVYIRSPSPSNSSKYSLRMRRPTPNISKEELRRLRSQSSMFSVLKKCCCGFKKCLLKIFWKKKTLVDDPSYYDLHSIPPDSNMYLKKSKKETPVRRKKMTKSKIKKKPQDDHCINEDEYIKIKIIKRPSSPQRKTPSQIILNKVELGIIPEDKSINQPRKPEEDFKLNDYEDDADDEGTYAPTESSLKSYLSDSNSSFFPEQSMVSITSLDEETTDLDKPPNIGAKCTKDVPLKCAPETINETETSNGRNTTRKVTLSSTCSCDVSSAIQHGGSHASLQIVNPPDAVKCEKCLRIDQDMAISRKSSCAVHKKFDDVQKSQEGVLIQLIKPGLKRSDSDSKLLLLQNLLEINSVNNLEESTITKYPKEKSALCSSNVKPVAWPSSLSKFSFFRSSSILSDKAEKGHNITCLKHTEFRSYEQCASTDSSSSMTKPKNPEIEQKPEIPEDSNKTNRSNNAEDDPSNTSIESKLVYWVNAIDSTFSSNTFLLPFGYLNDKTDEGLKKLTTGTIYLQANYCSCCTQAPKEIESESTKMPNSKKKYRSLSYPADLEYHFYSKNCDCLECKLERDTLITGRYSRCICDDCDKGMRKENCLCDNCCRRNTSRSITDQSICSRCSGARVRKQKSKLNLTKYVFYEKSNQSIQNNFEPSNNAKYFKETPHLKNCDSVENPDPKPTNPSTTSSPNFAPQDSSSRPLSGTSKKPESILTKHIETRHRPKSRKLPNSNKLVFIEPPLSRCEYCQCRKCQIHLNSKNKNEPCTCKACEKQDIDGTSVNICKGCDEPMKKKRKTSRKKFPSCCRKKKSSQNTVDKSSQTLQGFTNIYERSDLNAVISDKECKRVSAEPVITITVEELAKLLSSFQNEKIKRCAVEDQQKLRSNRAHRLKKPGKKSM